MSETPITFGVDCLLVELFDESALAASANSPAFKPLRFGRGGLKIEANSPSGNLNGTFVLAARNDSSDTFRKLSSYTFATGPAGAVWRFDETFYGMDFAEYQLQFTRVSGSGYLSASIRLV